MHNGDTGGGERRTLAHKPTKAHKLFEKKEGHTGTHGQRGTGPMCVNSLRKEASPSAGVTPG